MKKIKFLLGIIILVVILNIAGNNIKEPYIYKITKIDNNEIRGVAMTNKSSSNVGVFLFNSEISAKIGDEIIIDWGKNNEIINVKKKV